MRIDSCAFIFLKTPNNQREKNVECKNQRKFNVASKRARNVGMAEKSMMSPVIQKSYWEEIVKWRKLIKFIRENTAFEEI